jgi:hypothetical protein
MLHLHLLTVHPLHAYLVPVCFVATWTILFLILANFWAVSSETVIYAQKMHRIPCSKCKFFTANYQLKCTVHPTEALTEAAIDCPDYQTSDRVFDFDQDSHCATTYSVKDSVKESLEQPKPDLIRNQELTRV